MYRHVTQCSCLSLLLFWLQSTVSFAKEMQTKSGPVPTPCCLPNGAILKDSSIVTVRNATTITDYYEMITYTAILDTEIVEIQVFEPDRAQLWILDTTQPTYRRTAYLALTDGVWCKEPEVVENIADVPGFGLFRSGCSDNDGEKFVGWDASDNEMYVMRSASPASVEQTTLYLERLGGNRCKPAKAVYEREARHEDTVEAMTAESFFVNARRADVQLVEFLLSAKHCSLSE